MKRSYLYLNSRIQMLQIRWWHTLAPFRFLHQWTIFFLLLFMPFLLWYQWHQCILEQISSKSGNSVGENLIFFFILCQIFAYLKIILHIILSWISQIWNLFFPGCNARWYVKWKLGDGVQCIVLFVEAGNGILKTEFFSSKAY